MTWYCPSYKFAESTSTIALAGEDQSKFPDLGSSNGTNVNGRKIPAKAEHTGRSLGTL
jgi:pSer/pThr/pTyr-binding forkhead associated (FHA) protein